MTWFDKGCKVLLPWLRGLILTVFIAVLLRAIFSLWSEEVNYIHIFITVYATAMFCYFVNR